MRIVATITPNRPRLRKARSADHRGLRVRVAGDLAANHTRYSVRKPMSEIEALVGTSRHERLGPREGELAGWTRAIDERTRDDTIRLKLKDLSRTRIRPPTSPRRRRCASVTRRRQVRALDAMTFACSAQRALRGRQNTAASSETVPRDEVDLPSRSAARTPHGRRRTLKGRATSTLVSDGKTWTTCGETYASRPSGGGLRWTTTFRHRPSRQGRSEASFGLGPGAERKSSSACATSRPTKTRGCRPLTPREAERRRSVCRHAELEGSSRVDATKGR